MSWTPKFVGRRVWAILAFGLIALPGSIDAWLSLWEKYTAFREGAPEAVSLSLGDWWYTASVFVGLVMLVYILLVDWQERRQRRAVLPEDPSIAAERRHREEARRTVALAVVEHYNGLILGKPDAGSRLHSAAKIAWKHWLTPEEKDSKSVINRAFAVIATAHHDSDFTVTDKLTGAVRDFTEVWPPARTMMLPATDQASDDAPDTKPDPPANPVHVETLERLGGLWVDADQVLLQVVERGIDRAQSDPLRLLYELFEGSAMSGHVGKWNRWEKLLARLGEDAKQSAVDEAISELWDSVRLYCRLWLYSKRLSYSRALISDEAWVTEQGQLAEARATRLADALRDTQHTSLERLAELAPHVDAAVMGEVPTT